MQASQPVGHPTLFCVARLYFQGSLRFSAIRKHVVGPSMSVCRVRNQIGTVYLRAHCCKYTCIRIVETVNLDNNAVTNTLIALLQQLNLISLLFLIQL
jgi:hypothetical protein